MHLWFCFTVHLWSSRSSLANRRKIPAGSWNHFWFQHAGRAESQKQTTSLWIALRWPATKIPLCRTHPCVSVCLIGVHPEQPKFSSKLLHSESVWAWGINSSCFILKRLRRVHVTGVLERSMHLMQTSVLIFCLFVKKKLLDAWWSVVCFELIKFVLCLLVDVVMPAFLFRVGLVCSCDHDAGTVRCFCS